MITKNLLLSVVLAIIVNIFFGVSVAHPAEPLSKPNFIIIFADDLGYGDISPFGSKLHRTPNLEKMASKGIKLTNFYVANSVCTPSRASLMTGSYARRVGLHTNDGHGLNPLVLFPGDHFGLNPDEITLAEVLKDEGAATAIIGKWHLGDQPEFLPTRQGFDYYFGLPHSNDMGSTRTDVAFPPLPLLRNETVIETEPEQSQLTCRYTQEAIKFIRDHKDESFFLYLPHTMPHWPQDASAQFKGKSANGDYGDSIEELDWSTGQILDVLSELNIDQNTLIIFTSDNGASGDGSNAPLRGTKTTVWEGGMRVPAIAAWPGKIPAGSVSDELVLSMDLYSTVANLAGGQIPSDRIVDGKDIQSILIAKDGATTPHDRFYYYIMGSLAGVRAGNWKLHVGRTVYDADTKIFSVEDVLELYNLEEDVGERANLVHKHPEIVKRLQVLLEEGRKDIGDDLTLSSGENTRPHGFVEKLTDLAQ